MCEAIKRPNNIMHIYNTSNDMIYLRLKCKVFTGMDRTLANQCSRDIFS